MRVIMKLHDRIENNIYILRIEGDLSSKFILNLENHLIPIIEDEKIEGMVFNMEKTTFIDSSGIGLILSFYKTLDERGSKMSVCRLSDDNIELFQMTRLSDIMSIYATEKEAITSVSKK